MSFFLLFLFCISCILDYNPYVLFCSIWRCFCRIPETQVSYVFLNSYHIFVITTCMKTTFCIFKPTVFLETRLSSHFQFWFSHLICCFLFLFITSSELLLLQREVSVFGLVFVTCKPGWGSDWISRRPVYCLEYWEVEIEFWQIIQLWVLWIALLSFHW